MGGCCASRETEALVCTTPAAKEAENRLSPEQRKQLMVIFARMDKNKDGDITRIEMIKAVRENEDIATFFNIPQKITQEASSRTRLEKFFQKLAGADGKQITEEDFVTFYDHLMTEKKAGRLEGMYKQ